MAEPKVSIPITMRPRATANAELNAQNRERVVREMTGEPAPVVKDVPVRGYQSGGTVTPVAAPGAGIDPEWEKFQRENEAARKANRARKIERFAPIPTPGAGPPGQGYRPYGSDTSTDKFNQGGMVTKHGSSTRVTCQNKHR